MQRVKLTIEYKGTNYSGWQRQENAVGVQQIVEEALSYVLNEQIIINASGRTDEGVHALNQIAHFDTCTKVDISKIAIAANTHLPEDIRIKVSEPADINFNARYDAKSKTYLYKCYVGKVASPIRFDTHYQIPPPVDMEKMRQAAAHFIGEHDFKAFMGVNRNQKPGTVREIFEIRIEEREPDELWFYVTGSGFLYNMVRVMVRALISVGKGRIKPDDIPVIIKNKDRQPVKELAPAKGLYLYKVEY